MPRVLPPFGDARDDYAVFSGLAARLGVEDTFTEGRDTMEWLAHLFGRFRARHGEDWIEIDGNPDGYDGGVDVGSRGDHRVAQMLAIVGLRCRNGLRITRAESVSKSYPDFFADLQRMGVKLDLVPASD